MHGPGLSAWGWGSCLDIDEVRELEACIKGHGTCELSPAEVAELSQLPFCTPPNDFWKVGWFDKDRTDSFPEYMASTADVGSGGCTAADTAYAYYCGKMYNPGAGNTRLHAVQKSNAGSDVDANFKCWALQKDGRLWGNIAKCAGAVPTPPVPPVHPVVDDPGSPEVTAGLGTGTKAALAVAGLAAAYFIWRRTQ